MKNYHSIDVAKFIMILLVVSIHMNISSCKSVNHFFTNAIGRVAVPFFFICSGFLFLNKNNYITFDRLYQTLKRILILFVSWTIIYTLLVFCVRFNNVDDAPSLWALLLRFLFLNPFGHLWYLPALMIGIVGTWFFLRYNLKKLGLILAVILYIFGMLGDLYYELSNMSRVRTSLF